MTPPTPTTPTVAATASRPRLRARRLVAVTAATAASLSIVAACDGSEATPPPSPTAPSSTPANTTPSTPATSPRPPALTVPPASFSISSAEAFGRFFLTAKEYAALTGDASLMRKWANRTCNACRALADGYEQQYRSGGSITGQVQFRARRVDRVRLVRDDAAEVVLAGRIGRFVDLDHKSAKPSVYPGGAVTYRLALIWTGGRWLMYGMVIVE